MIQLAAVVLLGAAPTCGAKTPEDALRRIEEAYRTKDVELAVACLARQRAAGGVAGSPRIARTVSSARRV